MDAINDTMAAFYNDTDLFSGEFWHPPVFTSQPTAPNSSFLPTNTDPSTWQPEASHSRWDLAPPTVPPTPPHITEHQTVAATH